MTELLTAAQMRSLEAAAIASGEVTGLQLMERAGRGVVGAVFEEWPELAKSPHRAVVLCGPGNNGGDGFVVARRLRDKGWTVEVLLFGDPDKLPPDAKTNHDLWLDMGEVNSLMVETASQGSRPVLLVDAMFGTGLSRAIPLECANAFHAVEGRDVGDEHPWLVPYHKVAVDCPSGLDCDSGKILFPPPPDADESDRDAWWSWWKDDASRRILFPDLCVTFHRRRVGHYLGHHSFRLRVMDIGLGAEDRYPAQLIQKRSGDRVTLLDFDRPRSRSHRIWPGSTLRKRQGAHKYDHGHALLLSGGVGKGGAARLAARGAFRIGAGAVTVGCPPAALIENAAQLVAIMLRAVADAAALADILRDDRINAFCIGPGFGIGEREHDILSLALGAGPEGPGTEAGAGGASDDGLARETHAPDPIRGLEVQSGTGKLRATVLDADALTLLAEHGDLFASLHDCCVLTPHAGEFQRLFPDIAEKLDAPPVSGPAYSKVDATREAAKRAGCVVLFKGPDTVIADPDGRCAINSAHYHRAAPWLATAGSGDVLSGFITGLLARGLDPMQAAETAAWLHVECALKFGPGLIAEDLPEQLPKVFRDLGI